jgi:hypothetical protein
MTQNQDIYILDIQNISDFSLDEPNSIAVIMPCTDTEAGMKTAEVLHRRAGMDCTILIIHDTLRQGFVKTLNQTAARITAKYIVYLAQDAWPGRGWLKCGYDTLEKSGKGLLAFNDGKWHGRIASFGMIRTSWINSLYSGYIFYPGYISHAADLELTVLAQAHDEHVYNPHCTLIVHDAAKDDGGSNPEDQALYTKRFDQAFAGLAPASALQSIPQNYAITMTPPANPTSGQTDREQKNESRPDRPSIQTKGTPSAHPPAKVSIPQPTTPFTLYDAPQTLGVSVILPGNADLGSAVSSFLAWNTHAPLEFLVLVPELSSSVAGIVSQYVTQAIIRMVVHDPLTEGLEARPTSTTPAAYNHAASLAKHPILLYLAASGPEQIGHDFVPAVAARMQDQTIGAVCLQAGDISRGRDSLDSPSHSVLGLATTRSLFLEIGGFEPDVPDGGEFVHYAMQVGKLHRRVCWYVDGQWDPQARALIRRESDVSTNTTRGHDLPIVVVAYNRPASLIRLLHSLDTAQYGQEVQLIISVDGGDESSGVENMARTFQWRHGPKSVITHQENLGLKAHVIKSSDLAMEHDGAIVLEDDLLVSPVFYDYAQQAFDFYKNEQRIAGISLYSHQINETSKYPFTPLNETADVFFLQIPASWGVVWKNEQWSRFREWLNKPSVPDADPPSFLPGDVCKWPKSSWKKEFFKYIIEKDLFFVYPRSSFTTNFAEDGVHMKKNMVFQVPLLYNSKNYEFIPFDKSMVKYDSFCEILPESLNKLCPLLKKYDYCVDLYGMKPRSAMRARLVLTIKTPKDYICSFGREMLPPESNIIHQVKGNVFYLAKVESTPDLTNNHNEAVKNRANQYHITYYYNIASWILSLACKKLQE